MAVASVRITPPLPPPSPVGIEDANVLRKVLEKV
jgi:hypothetical protein